MKLDEVLTIAHSSAAMLSQSGASPCVRVLIEIPLLEWDAFLAEAGERFFPGQPPALHGAGEVEVLGCIVRPKPKSPLAASPAPVSEETLRDRITSELPNIFWEANERGVLGTLRIRAHQTGSGEVVARNVTMEHGKLIIAALAAKGGQ